MPKLDQHCAISKKRTGFDFRELHMWMDAPKDKLGYNHRIRRHLSTAFKKSKSVYGERTFNYIAFGLSKTNYVHLDHDAYSEYGLEEYFKNLKRPAIIDILHRLKDWILRRKHFVNIP
jgi:hypothetical protein